ncbi:MAG: BACON domain-containing carbohydrate-binding protein [Verrucomicrobiota bacterium]
MLYCDFDGEKVTSPHWNGGKLIDAVPIEGASDPAFVVRVWQRAAEDFAGFDINVTTDRKIFDAAPVSNRVMCVITNTNDAAPGAGGVAMLTSFGQDIPCWAFNPTEGSCSDTISHETGHTLGLMHDGTTAGVEYYGGNSLAGVVGWAPIMGAYFADRTEEEVTSWGKGEYPQANNKEDDLQIITTANGFGYRKDDHSDTRLGAAPFLISDGAILDGGVIERNTDVDWFSFVTKGGPFKLNVTVTRVAGSDMLTRGSNMAVSAELYNSTGKLVQSSNRPESLDAALSATLQPGTYYVKIDGVGRGTAAAGWSDYSSIGNYKVSGRFPLTSNLVISPAYLKYGPKGGEGVFNISAGDKWSWSTNVAWVESVEVTTQNGNQEFTYTVGENPSYAPRAAEIIISTGAVTASHSIIQAAKIPDDHGDDMKGSTTVDLNSTTDGRINFLLDVDMFEIHVTESGYLTVGTSGLTDTYGRLFDDQGVELASNDDTVKKNCRIVHPVAAGTTYYATVSLPPGAAYNPGVADYKFESSFASNESIIIDPLSRVTKPTAGEFGFDVWSNTDWTWTIWAFDGTVWVEDTSWLTSDESVTQNGIQRFTYTLAENTTAIPRHGQIRFRKVGGLTNDVIHDVVQTGLGNDDHGDTIETSTPITVNGSIQGVIEAEGDVDVFQIVLPAIGELTLGTTGTLDTFGYLLDADGNEIASNDDLTDFNFGITRNVAAGTYYVKVRHFQSTQTGAYQLFVGFKVPSFINLVYKVDRTQGILTGPVTQKLKPGANGRQVTAKAMSGYVFTGWSDGVATASRTDLKVVSDLTVTAMFSRILTVQIDGGVFLVDNEPSLTNGDFGVVEVNQPSVKNYVVKNIGPKPLTKINVTRFGPNSKDWVLAPLAKTTLNPGESMVLTATLLSAQMGTKSAVLTVNATGNPLPFRINVEGAVTGIVHGASEPTPEPEDQ